MTGCTVISVYIDTIMCTVKESCYVKSLHLVAIWQNASLNKLLKYDIDRHFGVIYSLMERREFCTFILSSTMAVKKQILKKKSCCYRTDTDLDCELVSEQALTRPAIVAGPCAWSWR